MALCIDIFMTKHRLTNYIYGPVGGQCPTMQPQNQEWGCGGWGQWKRRSQFDLVIRRPVGMRAD